MHIPNTSFALNSEHPSSNTIADATHLERTYAPSTWIEINRKSFEHNVASYKKIIGPSVQLALVVKSNAYGHSITKIGMLGQENPNVDWLCTSFLSEALFLRNHGITKPIIVLGIIDADPLLASEHTIDLVGHDMESIVALNTQAALYDKPLSLHLKIDTGLSRLGVLPHEAIKTIRHAHMLSHIKINGIFSHFAESDNPDEYYSLQQLRHFTHIVDELARENIHIPYKHACNSAGITNLSSSHFNFVRIGAGAYGLEPSAHTLEKAKMLDPEFSLRPVMTWKTKVMLLRTIPAGSFVGYGRTHQVTTDTTLAILPIGYYEGYDRRFGNKGIVCIPRDNRIYQAPVIGRVCMNITMIDVSHIPDIRIGDEVVLLGDYQGIRAHELAATIASFNPREITTRINNTLSRIIIES